MRIATTTQDLADLAWSPTSACFVVWDILLTYKLLIYDASGRCLASYSAYQDALGIRTIQWSPDGHLLAIGSYDQVSGSLSAILSQTAKSNRGSPLHKMGMPLTAQVTKPHQVLDFKL